MYFLKNEKGELLEINDENVFGICYKCGKQIAIDLQEEASERGIDLFGTCFTCADCNKKEMNAQVEEIEFDDRCIGDELISDNEGEHLDFIKECLYKVMAKKGHIYRILNNDGRVSMDSMHVNFINDEWAFNIRIGGNCKSIAEGFEGAGEVLESVFLIGHGDYWFFSKKHAMDQLQEIKNY